MLPFMHTKIHDYTSVNQYKKVELVNKQINYKTINTFNIETLFKP